MARLLVVEDDDTIGQLLEEGLVADGHLVRWVRTGRAALDMFLDDGAELVLLDLGLPDIDGVEVCRGLRMADNEAVIVMLTARRDEIDVIAGLDAGADDYLRKPFSIAELLARVRAHLRRTEPPADEGQAIQLGDLQIDLNGRRCLVAGEEIYLRRKEFDLLVRLASDPGNAVSRETLMSDVWDENWFGPTKTLDVTMATLRRRLEQAVRAKSPQEVAMPTVTTVRGHGYRLDRPDGAAPDQ
jgi:DNA-binding response OmpR family regulator